MLEQVDLSIETPKKTYKPLYDELITKLIVLQQRARAKGIGLVALFEGWNGAGKGSRIGDLLHNLDARATHVHVLSNFTKTKRPASAIWERALQVSPRLCRSSGRRSVRAGT